jgi:hypothetical protein
MKNWLTNGHRTGAADTINPDHIGMHRVVVFGVIITLAAAVITSWTGLLWVAEQQLLPPQLWWVTPVMIDVPLIVLTLARGALKKRGIEKKRLMVGIIALTLFSSVANLLHTIAETGFDTIPAVLGALTNALAPWLIVAMTEVLWLVVTKPIRPPQPRKKARPAKARSSRKSVPVQSVEPIRLETLPGLEQEHDALGVLRESAR